MKRVFLFLITLLSIQLIWAQVPQGITYQAVVRDGNTIFANQSVDILLGVLDANNIIIYEEAHNGLTTNAFGQISYTIGTGTPVIGQLSQVDWDQQGLYFLSEATINGIIYSLGRIDFESVPYAFLSERARVADSVVGGGSPELALNDLTDVMAVPTENGQLLVWNDSIWIANEGVLVEGPSLSVVDTGGVSKIDLEIAGAGDGLIRTYGPDGSLNLSGSSFSGVPNSGALFALGESGQSARALVSVLGGQGFMEITSGNSFRAIWQARANFNNSGADRGASIVFDDQQQVQAGIYVDATGDGIVFGDVKNFRMDHPNQPGKEIWYASLEGPEAAAYVRGTATLVNGQVEVPFPEHFEALASVPSMTVSLTPLSADSEGLAVIEKTETGFKVKELRKGKGNYSFDWEVKCIRKGYEDYKVVRDAIDSKQYHTQHLQPSSPKAQKASKGEK